MTIMAIDIFGLIAGLVAALGGPTGVLSTVIATVVAFASPFLFNILHLNASDTRRSYIQDAIKNALAYGVSVVAKQPNGNDLVAVKDDVIAVAKIYMNELVPEGLAKLKITDAGLTQLLEAGLVTGVDDLSKLLGNLIPRQAAAAAVTPTTKTVYIAK